MTNGDKIRTMSDDELAFVIMCPYDTAGEPVNIMPCVKHNGTQELVDSKFCHACCVEYLKKEVKLAERLELPEWKQRMLKRFMEGE